MNLNVPMASYPSHLFPTDCGEFIVPERVIPAHDRRWDTAHRQSSLCGNFWANFEESDSMEHAKKGAKARSISRQGRYSATLKTHVWRVVACIANVMGQPESRERTPWRRCIAKSKEHRQLFARLRVIPIHTTCPPQPGLPAHSSHPISRSAMRPILNLNHGNCCGP